MYSYTRHRKGTALLAVLQAILLLSALVLAPAASLAQEDPAGNHAQQAEPAEQAAAPAAEPAADRKLRLYPKQIKLFPGGKKVMSAWSCRADIGASFGPDKEPGTHDDDCTPVRAKWSVEPSDAAGLSNTFGLKTRVTLLAATDIAVSAKADGMTGKGSVKAKDAPAKVRPQATKAAPETVDTPTTPVVEEPLVEEPVVEEPVVETPADDCDVDPLTGECLPGEEIIVEEPVATEEPVAEEPVAEEPQAEEPVAEEPATCDVDPLTGECLGEAPVAEAAPEAEPTPQATPKGTDGVTLAANGTLRIHKGGFRAGGLDIGPLAGAKFDVWLDDGDDNFEPNGDDGPKVLSDATNGSGYVDVSLPAGFYWVREATAPTDWNKILQMAYGSGSNSNQTDNAYVDRYRVRDDQRTTTDVFVNRHDNNDYPDVCGLKVALVFDRSGSISDDTEYPKMKNAAKDFVDALTGTPSQFRVYSFSWTASTHGGWTSVADNAGANAVKNTITNLPATSGGTNWDDAFREVANDGAEVIVFMTDGNPTTYGAGTVDGSTVHLIDVELGVASANLAKSQSAQPKVVAIGIGNAVANPTNLKLISGPDVNDDYFIANFDNLKDKLQEIASKLCGGTITVLKEVPDGQGGWTPASGWTFSAASTGAAPTPTNGATNAQGLINFKYDLSAAPYAVTATVTETVQSGWELVQQGGQNAVCRNGSPIDETNVSNGVSIPLGIDDIVTCTFRNQPSDATLVVRKIVVHNNGGSAVATDFAFDVAGPSAQGPVSFVQDPDNASDPLRGKNSLTVDAGTYTVTEATPIPAGYTVLYDNCTNVVVTPGETETCTITNTDQEATITVVKVVENGNTGASAGPDDFDLTLEGNDVDSGVAVPVVPGTYTADETLLPGYTFDGYSGDCDSNGDTTVALGENKTCTLTNTAQQATLTLVKTVSGGDATRADFDPYIDTTLVTWGTPVPLVPGAYTASEIMDVTDYVAGNWGGDCAANGNVQLALGQNLTCSITNFYAELEITKSADPSFYAEVGDEISYTITATNTGNATLTGVVVTDEFPDGLDDWDCSLDEPATLAPGASIVCTATHAIVQADINAGSVFNQACADANQISDEVCDDETVRLSELAIVKEADVSYYDAVGDVINYTITATNTGETALTDVDITDNLFDDLDGWTCDPTLTVDSLPAGESIVCTASYTIVQADMRAGTVYNQACADSDETSEVCDDVTTPLARLVIVKEASVDYYTGAGEEIVYTVTASNTGEADLTDVDITDALIDGLDDWTCTVGNATVNLPADTLLSGQSIVCTATYTTTAADVRVGTVFNQACTDSNETGEDCDNVEIPYAELVIVKEADSKTYTGVGDQIEYTITATNTGVSTLTDVDISDALIDGLNSWSCDPDIPVAQLASGNSIVCTAMYTITQADMDAGQVFNQACVDSDETPEVCDEVIVYPISIVIVKTPSQKVADSGDKVTFTLDYSHNVPISLYAVSLEDDIFGDLFDADNPKKRLVSNGCVDGFGEELLPDTWYSCEFTAKVYGKVNKPHVNTVTITATDTDPNGQPPEGMVPRFADASDDAKVKFKGGGGSGGGGGQPPTDMLLVTDTITGADAAGSPFGGPLSWAAWVLLSALLIVSSAWVIRRQRYAEASTRL